MRIPLHKGIGQRHISPKSHASKQNGFFEEAEVEAVKPEKMLLMFEIPAFKKSKYSVSPDARNLQTERYTYQHQVLNESLRQMHNFSLHDNSEKSLLVSALR